MAAPMMRRVSAADKSSKADEMDEENFDKKMKMMARKSSTWDDSSTLASRSPTMDAPKTPITDTPDVRSLIEQARYLEGRFTPRTEQTPFVRVVQRLISFCQKYAVAGDLFAQYGGSPALVIWGSMRAILIAAESSFEYFRLLQTALLKITDSLSLAEQFEDMFVSDKRVGVALVSVYDGIKGYLDRILAVMRRRKWRRVFDNITSSFQEQFRDQGENLQRRMQVLHNEVKVAHMKRVKSFQGEVRENMEQQRIENAVLVHLGEQQSQKGLKESILKWLAPADVVADLDRVLKRRKDGTGHWLPAHATFRQWADATAVPNKPCLALMGSAGRGKSVLAGTAIEHLQQMAQTAPSQTLVAYFFCSGEAENRRSETDITAAIISQLIVQLPELPAPIVEAYQTAQAYGRTRRSDQDKLQSVLRKVSMEISRLYLIIDGLDESECPEDVAIAMMETAATVSSVRLLCCSRPLPKLLGIYGEGTTISLEQDLVQSDISIYLSDALQGLPCEETLRREAYATLSAAHDGMFLYAALGIEALSSAVDARGIQECLGGLPDGIYGFYESFLRRLAEGPPARRRLSSGVLLWVINSRRSLTWAELEYALSWDDEAHAFSPERRPFKSSVVEICFPLIEYRQDTDTFGVSHASVRDLIHSRPRSADSSEDSRARMDDFFVDAEMANSIISQRLLTELVDPSTAHSIDPDRAAHPLNDYSTTYWAFHVHSSTPIDALKAQVRASLADAASRVAWIARRTLFDRTTMPLQELLRTPKQIKAWLASSTSRTDTSEPKPIARSPAYYASDLMDIQRALIMLDDLPHDVLVAHPPIPTFERLMWVRDLVRACNMANQVPEALAFFESALATSQDKHGIGAPQTAWLLNSIGLLLQQQGDVQRSLDTHLIALEIQRAHLPADHLDIVSTLNETGRLHRHLGQYEKSEACHRAALAAISAVLPESDLQVIWTLNTLGRCLQKSGGREKALEALRLHNRALAGQRKLLGPNHPHAIWTITDIARCIRDLGRLKEAKELLEEALERRKKILGDRHPDTLWLVNSLALVIEEMGMFREAMEMHEQAYSVQREVLGVDHPHAQWSLDMAKKLRLKVEGEPSATG